MQPSFGEALGIVIRAYIVTYIVLWLIWNLIQWLRENVVQGWEDEFWFHRGEKK